MTVSFDTSQPLVIVEGRIFGPSAQGLIRLAVDTGASTTVISQEALEHAGCVEVAGRGATEIVTASGLSSADHIVVGRFDALESSRSGYPVLRLSLPDELEVDGLLGLDFFRDCALAIDFRNGTIDLR